MDFVSLLGVGYTQRPCPGNLLRSLLFKGPSRDFVVYRPFGVPEASIWDFGMIHVCVNVGCFPFDCPFFCRFANVIFFELVVFSLICHLLLFIFIAAYFRSFVIFLPCIVHLSSVVPVSSPCNYV